MITNYPLLAAAYLAVPAIAFGGLVWWYHRDVSDALPVYVITVAAAAIVGILLGVVHDVGVYFHGNDWPNVVDTVYGLAILVFMAAVGMSSIWAAKKVRATAGSSNKKVGPSAEHTFTPTGGLAYQMYEEEAVDITAQFGEVYATCNEERWLFKPQSLLPRECDTVVRAMKVSYQTGYPFPEQLEGSYRHCFPQIALFVPDDQFDRAMAYFERLRQAIKNERHHPSQLDLETAEVYLNGARGRSSNGNEFDDFFEIRFLADAPPDPDKSWVQQLARDCWRDFRSRISEWSEFVTLVKAGETGPEPKDVALAPIELNKTRREIDHCIDSLRRDAEEGRYAEIIAQID